MIFKAYVAEKRVNDLMEKLDLKPDYKIYVDCIHYIESKKFDAMTEEQTIAYFKHLVNADYSEDGVAIPLVEYKGKLYAKDGLKEVSDGQTLFFIQEKERA